MITVHRIENDAAFRALESEWDGLLARSPSDSIFRTWAWQHSWWEHFQGAHELWMFAARDGSGVLVGLAPLCLTREGSVLGRRTLRFLGTERVSSEYLDILVAADVEEASALALLDAIERTPGWDVLALTDLPDGAAALRHWLRPLHSRGFQVERSVSQEIPYLTLPESLEALRHRLGHSLRGAVSRATRKLAAAGFTYRAETDPARLPETLERLFELHAARWATRNRPGNFQDDRVRAFHRSLAGILGTKGIRLGTLTNGDRIIAMLYALERGRTLSYYQSGFDPVLPHPSLRPTSYSPGLVLIDATVEDAVERGLEEFDFLRGDEPYKDRWTHARRRTWALTAVRPGAWRAKRSLQAKRWVRSSRSRVKQLVRRSQADPRRLETARRPGAGGATAPRPICVMHVVEELQLAGMEYGVIKVVNRLPDRVHGSICCLRHQAEVTKPVVDPRVRVVSLGARTSRNYGLIRTLAALFRRESVDVVHSHNWQTYLYAVLGARLAGVPVVIHGEHGHDDLATSWRRRWIQRALAPLVTRFLAVSEDLARELRDDWGLEAERVSAMPNGVDLSHFTAEANGGSVIRRELSLEAVDDVLIHVGGIRRVKDHDTLLRAFARVRAMRPNARLLLVGADCDPTLHDELFRTAGELGVLDHVRFTGVRRDVPELLQASDVYVNTSRFEGMSNTILEAMAMKKPVVATEVGGNAELVTEGVTGHLAPAGDADAIARRIVSLLEDPGRRRAFGEAGRAVVERSHSIEAMVARYAEVYETCYDHWWIQKTEGSRS